MEGLELLTENCSGIEFIHYGHKRFNPKKFEPIINFRFTKPSGGFWASPVDSERSWRDWCEAESFHTNKLAQSFTFKLSDAARVCRIRSVEDLLRIPLLNEGAIDVDSPYPGMVYPDFEGLLKMGVDAVMVEISRDVCLYWALYGWDCDSILIMNPDVIVEV